MIAKRSYPLAKRFYARAIREPRSPVPDTGRQMTPASLALEQGYHL